MKQHNILALSLAACLVAGPLPVCAAPQGGNVAAGSASISQSGATTTVNQSSNRAVINWRSFDIGKSEAVRHTMPSARSAALHRVVGGGGASHIEGLLKSNGNIYLVNPAGVVIHRGARINTNSFTATSRDIANDNFMQGKMVFDKPGRPDAQVINEGTITVGEKGLAALVAPTVRNDGVIAGRLARVALASGNAAYTLDMYGDKLITFAVSDADVNGMYAADGTPLSGNAVTNSGAIKTDGGVVVLTSAQLDGIVGSVVNTGGVEAGEVNFIGKGSGVDVAHSGTASVASATGKGGVVRMDTDGNLAVSGTIDATGAHRGGSVTLTGETVALKAGASVNASGATGGGTVLVGGNALGQGPERNAKTTSVAANTTIRADATTRGNGGQVVVWSDGKTTFDGSITAQGGPQGGNGGKVETSGHTLKIGSNASVSTAAPKGNVGMWLLDPVRVTIGGADSNFPAAKLNALLQYTGVSISAGSLGDWLAPTIGNVYPFGNESGMSGDIIITSKIILHNFLNLNASDDVYIYAPITSDVDGAELQIVFGGSLVDDSKFLYAAYSSSVSRELDRYNCFYSFNRGASRPSLELPPLDLDFATFEDREQNYGDGFVTLRHNWLSRDRERGGDELSLLWDEIAVGVAALNDDIETLTASDASEDTTETVEVARLDTGDAATAANSGLAAYFREKAKAGMAAANELINKDHSSMNDQKRIAALDNLGEGLVNLIVARVFSGKGGQGKDTGFSDLLESAMVEVPEGAGRKLLQQSFGGNVQQQVAFGTAGSGSSGNVQRQPGGSGANNSPILAAGPGSSVDVGGNVQPQAVSGADSPVILRAADSGVDERVVASLNKTLGGVFNAIARAGQRPGGDFMENASDTVAEALKNDEQLQRYIDLYNYYVTEKMSLAGAIMG